MCSAYTEVFFFGMLIIFLSVVNVSCITFLIAVIKYLTATYAMKGLFWLTVHSREETWWQEYRSSCSCVHRQEAEIVLPLTGHGVVLLKSREGLLSPVKYSLQVLLPVSFYPL